MAHNIMGDVAFVGRKLPAWHGLGLTKLDPFAFTDTLPEAGMDYTITKRPMGAIMEDNSVYISPGKFVLMRGPSSLIPGYAALGECSASYDYFQNSEIAGLLDFVSSETGWEAETIGALGDGAKIFLTLNCGMTTVAGEAVQLYLLYVANRDGKNADYIIATATRVVCSNTLGIAMNGARGKITLNHSSTMRDESAWRLELISAAAQQGNDLVSAMRKLPEIPFCATDLEEMTTTLFPLETPNEAILELKGSNRESLVKKAENHEKQIERNNRNALVAREYVTQNYTVLCDQYPEISNTGWGAYQAVTEYVTHQMGQFNNVRGRKPDRNTRAREDLMGDGVELRTRAYEYILAR